MIRSTIAALLLAAALVPQVVCAAEQYRIDLDHTFAHFAVIHTGVSSVRGRMAVSKGSAVLDPGRSAEVTVELNPGSIDTGVKRLDATLASEMFFDTGRHRSARFTGRATRFQDGMPAEFEGELTLKGVTRPVTLVADRFTCKQVKILVLDRYVCGGDLHASVKRSEFGLGKYADMVSDEVQITLSVEAIRED
jgi:polyisoprenoid-binding protein YceI